LYGLYGFFFRKLYGLYGFLLKMYGFLYGFVQKCFGHPVYILNYLFSNEPGLGSGRIIFFKHGQNHENGFIEGNN